VAKPLFGVAEAPLHARLAWSRTRRLPVIPPVVWLTAERITQQALSIALFAVLVPILGPRPYGVFAIVMVFVGFCEIILLDSTVEALVSIDELDHKHTTAANLANSILGLVLGLTLFAIGPLIARTMSDDDMRNVIWALAPMPLLSSLSAVPVAVLRRGLKYRQLAIRAISGLTVGGAIGIALALAGAGVWALVLQVLAQRIAELVIAWIGVPVRFGLAWSAPHFRELRPVALNVFTAKMMTLMTGQVPRLVLGYALGATDVGLFALGNRFLEIIIHTTIVPRAAIGRIELRAEAFGSAEFRRKFANMARNASILAFPFSLGAAALLPELFRLWLSNDWQAGIVPAQLIVLSGAPMVFFYNFDAALLAGNLSSVYRRVSTIQGVTVAVTALCAAPFGLTVTCLALAIRPWVLLPIIAVMFRCATGISVYRAFLPSMHPLIGSVIMASLLTVPIAPRTGIDGVLALALEVSAGVLIYLSYLYVFARNELRALLQSSA
jgi:O-antigen/teichoic acid export membrane protein